MSSTDFGDTDVADIANKFNTLLAVTPAEEPAAEAQTEADVPVEPKARKVQQRNTVEPQPQESAPEEASAEDGTEGDESPTLQAPTSWDDEAKAKWAKLPQDVKELVTARETERDKAVNTRLQEAAEIRKKAEAENSQTLQLRNAYEQRLTVLAKQIESNIPAEFRNIQSPQDLAKLAENDPAAAQRFFVWREMAQGVLGEIQQLENQKVNYARAQQEEVLQREVKSLKEKWPEVMDSVRGPALRGEISNLLTGFGFSDEEIGGITDHRILLFAKEYMKGQSAIKALDGAKAKVTAKPLPKVIKPTAGAVTGPASGINKAQMTKAARSGDMAATQAALEKLLAS